MDIHRHIFLLSGFENTFFFISSTFFPLSCNDNNDMTYKWPNSSFFNFQENANQENCRQYSSIIFSIDKFGNKEPDEQKIYGWTEFFTSWTITREKMHTGARARKQKYIYLSIYLSVWKPFWKRVYIYIKRCNLCLKEKFLIICPPELSTLNKRNELVSSCRHRNKALLRNNWCNEPRTE